ncbi:hypothetical protein HU200_024067 [Digitaria exilis]|uniref:Uncharacterized protein n=1 Tax=Digitaria exilis TaxID=1010633 RepID=A0A835EY21_9POAL|nr:hypothetical protein HU200_024067 [Digitaria exilis]
MGLLSSANRCGCKNLLSCNLLRCTCCCSWIRGVCGRKNREATQDASEAKRKKKKRKWLRSFCGGAVRESEEPLTSESKKKKKNPVTNPDAEKCRWTKKIWRKKKRKNEQNGLANLVKEISLTSNNPAFTFLTLDFPSACKKVAALHNWPLEFNHASLNQC